ncbi:unnamed protein product [Hymenolepis diminuta]|uniref:EGF-like domain-containing protein n=1 Tax=Hymenolepis diminuta TaxID=6216 RepID=A0A158QCS5_HYMDI|nr:unnamed protein product [Hymenolepis diminuta]
MHLGLTYDSSRNCDESPYKVTVCIGHKHDKCRIFGPHLFYVQAACAAYGPKEVIQFEVDSVEEPLRVDATIKETNGDMEFQLQPVTANLTFPRPIDAKTKNLKIILQFQFAYTCVADYFGDLCNVFCSSEAKEYRCSLTGEKICNSGYIKDNETGACIYDRCGSMPNYCLNGGRCVNKAQDEEDALDTTTMPICICPPTRMGARCEVFRVPPTSSTTTSSTTTTTPATTSLPSTTTLASKPSGEIVAGKLINNGSIARYSNSNADGMKATGSLQDHSNPDRELWYQVMIFTIVAVCLTIIAFGVCLVAGCYVFRLKAKAALLRRHQESHYGDMQFVDGGCLGSPGGVTPGNVTADGLGGSAAMPIYLQRCPNIDYCHTLQRPPSVRSFSVSRPPTSNNFPSDTAQIPTDQPFIFSNGFNHQNDGIAWPTIYRSPAKGWGDFGFETFTRAPPISTQSSNLELSVHGDTLPTVNSPEAYTCRHDPYGYLSELHNHLGDPINTSAPPVMNNMLTLQTSTILSPSVIQPVSKSPIEVENGTLEMRKNDFQMAPAPPPSEFADLVSK